MDYFRSYVDFVIVLAVPGHFNSGDCKWRTHLTPTGYFEQMVHGRIPAVDLPVEIEYRSSLAYISCMMVKGLFTLDQLMRPLKV